ncbi:MAG: hypothetical protein JO340_21330 [Acidobacteriaceae bacterium]|nr:hypothetical protein [Acidobacteriaceae bacterium]
MNFISRLLRTPNYTSVTWHESRTVPGVRFAIKRMSLGERIELTRQVRELALRYEFLKSGEPADHLEAALSDLLAKKLYMEWGLRELEGFRIDGQDGTPALLIEKGPEILSNEVSEVVQAELTLSDDERKNF